LEPRMPDNKERVRPYEILTGSGCITVNRRYSDGMRVELMKLRPHEALNLAAELEDESRSMIARKGGR